MGPVSGHRQATPAEGGPRPRGHGRAAWVPTSQPSCSTHATPPPRRQPRVRDVCLPAARPRSQGRRMSGRALGAKCPRYPAHRSATSGPTLLAVQPRLHHRTHGSRQPQGCRSHRCGTTWLSWPRCTRWGMPFGRELPVPFERAQGPLNLGAVLLTDATQSRTTILPVLSPRRSPRNASTAFSIPSTNVSRDTS